LKTHKTFYIYRSENENFILRMLLSLPPLYPQQNDTVRLGKGVNRWVVKWMLLKTYTELGCR